MAHPIRPDYVEQMNNFYTATIYDKGAEVIRMVHTLLGEAGFQAGMKLYFQRHDGQAVTCEDFIQAMQDANTHVDLTQFRRWYSQSGTPLLQVTEDYSPEAQEYRLTVTQINKPTHDQSHKELLHIPLNVQLYDGQAQTVIPLHLQQAGPGYQAGAESVVLHVTAEQQTFVFTQVPVEPVLSLLRGFSAPVRIEYAHSDMEMIFLMQHATDDISRWDASQSLLAKYFRAHVLSSGTHSEMHLPDWALQAFREVLSSADDTALRAQILQLPSERELAELFDIVEPDRIHEYRMFLFRTMGAFMQKELLETYHGLQQTEYRLHTAEMAQRALRNVCLMYLAHLPEHQHLVKAQYYESHNMTDTLAALAASVYASLPCRDELLSHFAQQWDADALVLDKFFALSAAIAPPSEAINRIKSLMKHHQFDLSNPNRVYALIGSLAARNPVAFHQLDGSGYQFLGDVLMELDSLVPSAASRLIDPLLQWRRYSPARAALMIAQLQRLRNKPHLSSDLTEKITHALPSADDAASH
jgi:aminopeptidase N